MTVVEPDFIAVVPRAQDPARYGATVKDVLRWSDEADLDGALIFNGTGALLDPWTVATAAAAGCARLSPLVALNPVYQHPFTAARMVASIGMLFDRRVDLNLITGTAISDLNALGDGIDHDERYARLAEFTEIVTGLLSSARPFSFDGRFYQVSRLQLTPSLPQRLLPRLYVAGQSPAAGEVARKFDATNIRMLAAPGTPEGETGAGALHFGIVARPDRAEAAAAARSRFPEDPLGAKIVTAAMSNTDSTWKRRLHAAALADDGSRCDYWLKPFGAGQADCPYLVADYDTVVTRLTELAGRGVRTFVIDTPADEAEFHHLAKVAELTRQRLRTARAGES